jgi:hypothetical protein
MGANGSKTRWGERSIDDRYRSINRCATCVRSRVCGPSVNPPSMGEIRYPVISFPILYLWFFMGPALYKKPDP